MSTQAPSAAPSPSPSAAAGSSDQSEARADQQRLPDPAKVRKGLASDPRKIKPIPNKSKVDLPGVDTGFNPASAFDTKLAKALGRDAETGEGMDMGDGAEFGTDTPAPKPAKVSKAQADRGPDGKFTRASGEAAEGAEGEESEEQTEEALVAPELPEGEEDEAETEIASPQYKELEQKYKSLQGMFKPIQLEKLEAIKEQHGAAKSAVAWQKKAQALEAENAQLRQQFSGQGAAAGVPRSGGSDQGNGSRQLPGIHRADDIAKSVPWAEYAEAKAAGDDAAAFWLISHVLKIVDADRDKALTPLRDETGNMRRQLIEEPGQKREVARHAVDVFSSVADMKGEEGQPLFPELHEEAAAASVGKVWVDSDGDPKALLTPRGVINAILWHRFIMGTGPRPTPRQVEEAVEEAAGEEEEQDESGEQEAGDDDKSHLNARSVRALASGKSTLPVSRTSRAVNPSDPRNIAATIKNAMRDTSEQDNLFGFPTARKRR